jgi:uncharacterized protein with PIN domain
VSVIRYYVDEHIAGAVVRALRVRGVDVMTVTEAGLRQAEDDEHLAFALRDSRVTVTCDADFLRHHAQGTEHAGIVYAPRQMAIGTLLRRLLPSMAYSPPMRCAATSSSCRPGIDAVEACLTVPGCWRL